MNEFKGRFAHYYRGDREAKRIDFVSRVSLSAIRLHYGTDIARTVLTKKRYIFSNTHWYELEPLPDERDYCPPGTVSYE